MKQIALLPSGCQTWNKNIIDSGGGRFIYCSTLATYQHSLYDYTLQKLVTAHDRTIAGLTWCPSNPNWFATCAVDLRVMKWDVSDEKELASITLDSPPLMIDWSAHEPNIIAVLTKTGVGIWDTDKNAFEYVDALKCLSVTCLRWNHSSGASKLAIGHTDGQVWIWDKKAKCVSKIVPQDKKRLVEMVDLQWDPLSNNYILASGGNGVVFLIDAESNEVSMEFSRQNVDVTMSAFVRSMPGNFLTVNERAPVISLWNVSQQNPMDLMKLSGKKCGMHAIKSTSVDSKFLLAFTDGSVGVFDLDTRRLEFMTQPAHSETVFDCRYKTSSPDILATASYDSTIKIWDTRKMTCQIDLRGQEGVLYAVSWCPGDAEEHRLASASSTGEVFIWDSRTGQVLQRLKHHTKPSFRVEWNPINAQLIASTSGDGYCIVFDDTGKILKKYKHSTSVYGCDWNRFKPNLLVTGCHDSVVRIWDVSSPNTKPIHEFNGHTARVFNTVWSPLLADRVASGSDDKTIRIWSTQTTCEVVVLKGHTNNVRALVWSHEIPYILLSGSWDGTIRIWDIRSQTCIHTIYDHHADVYGLASHPRRPFVYASSSRDTSLRFWSIDELIVSTIKIQAVLDGGVIQPSNLEEVGFAMQPTAPLRLSGPISCELSKRLRELKNDLQQYTLIFQYFTNLPGIYEFWQLVDALVNNKSCDPTNSILHINELRNVTLAQAKSLESGNRIGLGGGKKRDRLAAAADIYLRLGQIKEYCEAMVELGEWERAIAISPSVSIGYWKNLSQRYAAHLVTKSDANALPYLIATGDVEQLVHHQLGLKEYHHALLTAVADASHSLPHLPNFEIHGDYDNKDEKADGARDNLPVTPLIRTVIETMADQYFIQASPILAACCHLAIGDAMRAVQRLVHGEEIHLAVALCRVLKLQSVDFVFRAMAELCESKGLWEDALRSLHYMRDPSDEIILLAARFQGATNLKAEFYLKAGIRSMEAFICAAEQHVKDGKKVDALTCFVAGGQYERAVTLGVEYIKELLSQPSWSLEEVSQLQRPLNSIPAHVLPQEIRYNLLVHSYYIGAHHAMNHGFTPIVGYLFDSVHGFIARGINFVVPQALIKLQEANYMANYDPIRGQMVLQVLLNESNASAKLKAGIVSVKKIIDQALEQKTNIMPIPSKHAIVPSCSNLPSGSNKRHPTISAISRAAVSGGRITLSDGITVISRGEAAMLFRVTPYEPPCNGIHSGKRLYTQ